MFNKTIDVKIFTTNEILIKDKILGLASNPDDFKEVKAESRCPFSKFSKYILNPTIVNCNGINHFFNKTLLLNCWSDVVLKAHDNNIEYEFANKSFGLSQHGNHQFKPMYENMVAPKLEAPFFIETSEKLNVLGSEAFYHFKNNRTYDNLKFPSGIIPTNFRPNVIGMIKSGEESFIKYNDPLMYFTFLTNKNIKIHYELIKFDDLMHKINQLGTNKFIGGLKGRF